MVCITQTEVNAVFDEQVRRCADILQKKTKEYTGDDTDRLGAFKAAAALQHCSPERALAGMLAKPIVSLYEKEHDGRISRDNKAWAQTIPVCEYKDGFGYDRNVYFVVDRSNTGLLDLFLTQARQEYAQVQEKKPSVRDSLNKSSGQQAHTDRSKPHKQPERGDAAELRAKASAAICSEIP